MTKQVKIVDLVDGDGFKLPPNFSTQFRDLQGGVEYLKDSADTITSELRTVGKKLNTHTTDLGSSNKVGGNL